MGYNLWSSEDERYALGRRLRRVSTETTERHDARTERAEHHVAQDLTQINALMDELARRLEQRRLGTCWRQLRTPTQPRGGEEIVDPRVP